MTGARRLRPESAAGGRCGRRIGPAAGTLFTGGITITKESQVLSKLYPQASASAESPGSQRSNGPANCQEEKGKRPVYLQLLQCSFYSSNWRDFIV